MALTIYTPKVNDALGETVRPQMLSSSPFVLNSNAKVASTDTDDPNDIFLNGTAAHRCIVNPGFPYIDFFQVVSGATTPSTPLAIRPYGFFPFDAQPSNEGLHSFDSTNFDPYNQASLLGPAGLVGLWLPLLRPADGIHTQTFSATVSVDKDDVSGSPAAKRLKIIHLATTIGARAQCAGASHVITLISTASAGETASMLVGRFSSF
jgi:hypothetical protein